MGRRCCCHRFLANFVLTAVVLLFSIMLMLATNTSAHSQASAPPSYLVKFVAGAPEGARLQLLEAASATDSAWVKQLDLAIVQAGNAKQFIAVTRAAVGKTVLYVEADGLVYGAMSVVDPALADPDQGYGPNIIHAPDAWDITTGVLTTTIAVLDTGINLEHTEFSGRLVPGYDFVGQDGAPTDVNGHGTHIAGILGAAIDGQGTVGVCPGCRIMPVQVLNENQEGRVSFLVQGILFAVDHGARVINLSLGTTSDSLALRNAIDYAYTHDVLVIAAAGNSGSGPPVYPAALDHVIAVGATDDDDNIAPFSHQGDYLDVAAPGLSIYSTALSEDEDGYCYMSGTSMATAYVSGLAGLALSITPSLTPDVLTDLITQSSLDLGEPGHDPAYGFGRIEAYQTVFAASQIQQVMGITVPPLTDHIFCPLISR